jgi:XTP/dITP diphosphohydrolase
MDFGKLPENATTLAALQELIGVVAQLRSPDGGCPWDLAQTPQTLTPYIIEEAYEAVDAIQHGDQNAVVEELGDLLLQVVLQAQIASECADFSLKEVAEGISQKLIRRHPHVFGDQKDQEISINQVKQNWEDIKAAEKGKSASEPGTLSQKLGDYNKKLPPLVAAMKISQKAAEIGFEWKSIEGVWNKFEEELVEFRHALAYESSARQEEELGDLIFAIVQLSRWNNLNPSQGMQGTNQRFIQRLQKMEVFAERPLADYSLDELEALWQQAKQLLAKEDS